MENTEYLTIEQAAEEELPWLTPGAIRKLVTRRKIPFRKPGGRIVLLRSELRRWVENAPGRRLTDREDIEY